MLNSNGSVTSDGQFVTNRGRPNNSLNPTANSDAFIENAFLIQVVRGGLSQALGCFAVVGVMERL